MQIASETSTFSNTQIMNLEENKIFENKII